jgi:hypothetical protein
MKQASRQEKSAKSVKAAIKREKSDACISFSEREQTRPKVKSVVKNKTTSKIMKKETIKYIIQLIVAVLTAIGSTLSVTTAASGAPAEGVALLGGTIVGTGWLHHLSTLV